MTTLTLLPVTPPDRPDTDGLLGLVMQAQRLNSELLGTRIGTTADALRRLVAVLAGPGRPPLLTPVSAPGERLTGAALALTQGTLQAADLTRPLDGCAVLLVDGVVTSTVRLEQQARLLRGLGAQVDHAAVVRLMGPPGEGTPVVHELDRP